MSKNPRETADKGFEFTERIQDIANNRAYDWNSADVVWGCLIYAGHVAGLSAVKHPEEFEQIIEKCATQFKEQARKTFAVEMKTGPKGDRG